MKLPVISGKEMVKILYKKGFVIQGRKPCNNVYGKRVD